MKVTVIHSFYRGTSVSGENLAVTEQTKALRDLGINVRLVARYSDQTMTSRLATLQSAVTVATGFDMQSNLPRARSTDDVLLINNLFPNFGSRWIDHWPGPVVTMIHNFRYLCANALLLREGKPCTLCLGGTQLPALRYRCYQDSLFATIPLAVGNYDAVHRLPQLSRASVVVTQSERAYEVFSRQGIPLSRLHLVPGFTNAPPISIDLDSPRSGWLFVGRLSAEKGLRELMSIWPDSYPLDIVGDGPDRQFLERLAPNGVRFLGSLPHDKAVRMMGSYEGLIFPGLCWEGAHPRVLRESLSVGTPVLAAIGSSAADLVQTHGGGMAYDGKSRDDLKANLDRVQASTEKLRDDARQVAAEVFGRERWQREIASVLAAAVADDRTQC